MVSFLFTVLSICIILLLITISITAIMFIIIEFRKDYLIDIIDEFKAWRKEKRKKIAIVKKNRKENL